MNGIVEAISLIGSGQDVQNNNVLINGTWSILAPYIKIQYIKPQQEVDYTIKDGVISYISPKKPYGQSKFQTPFKQAGEMQDRQQTISKQACINSALKLFELNRADIQGIITAGHVLRHAEIFLNWVQKNEIPQE